MAGNIEWHCVADMDSVSDYLPLPVEIGSENIALCVVDDQVYATANICSHAHALLSDGYIDKDCIVCPIHQAKFHIPTGKVQCAPATEDIGTYPVKIIGSQIHVGIPAAT